MIGLMTVMAFTSGCARWVLGDFSRPVMLVDGKVVMAEKPKGLELVPIKDLRFEIAERTEGFAVTISSAKWDLEGCGVGTGNGEMIIHSICGTKNREGGKLVVEEPGERAGQRIFLEDSRGNRHPIP
jgi:hypothetical protein